MKKIIITGANGLLGQALVKTLEGKHELLATARNASFAIPEMSVNYQSMDITDWNATRDLVGAFQPDVIINAAAYTNVDGCETHREECWRANVKGVENLARAARRNMAQLVHVSTDYIFDGENGPYDETHPPNPLGYYGKAKLASENTVRMTGIPYAIIRTNVVYGVGAGVKNNFFLWVYNSLKSGKNINVVTDQFNNPTLAEDLAIGIQLLIEKSKYGIFNIAGEPYLNRFDFACKIAEVFGFSQDLIHPVTSDALVQASPRPMRGGLVIDKAKRELDYHPRSLENAFTFLAPFVDAENLER